MDRAELEDIIDGMIYDVLSDMDSTHSTFLPSQMSMRLASLIMDRVEREGWRSPKQVAASIKPWEDEARARRGVRAGCTI